jgi:hypothetical protein
MNLIYCWVLTSVVITKPWVGGGLLRLHAIIIDALVNVFTAVLIVTFL